MDLSEENLELLKQQAKAREGQRRIAVSVRATLMRLFLEDGRK